MKTKSRESNIPAGLFGRRFLPVVFLVPLCALLTGCPHNDYTVELKPTAQGVERTLTFYRVDGGNFETFPTNELAAIAKVYPAHALISEGGTNHVVRGEFNGAMPQDVGGAGAYTNYVTSLGESGFYSERFRGEDDLAGRKLKQFKAADQLTDLVLGWTKAEFGHEQGYQNLRRFLDQDFRGDLKNAGQYFQTWNAGDKSGTNGGEEFVVRYCQYLCERGYLKLADVPRLTVLPNGTEGDALMLSLVQRVVAEKMAVAGTNGMAKSLAILTNEAGLEKSWNRYLAQTELYRVKSKEWQAKLKSDPKLSEPKPEEVANELFMATLGISSGFGSEPDHLTVKLRLKHEPDHSNGRWQDGQVVWDTDLSVDRALPVLCYASWNSPEETFQNEHFGRVLLQGDDLLKYSLWRSGLNVAEGQEWDGLVASLQPGDSLPGKIEAFHKATAAAEDRWATGRHLLMDELKKNAEGNKSGAEAK